MTAEKKWQKILRLLVAFGFGLAIAVYAYVRVSDPEPSMQRAREEKVVTNARAALKDNLKLPDDLQVVDPLAPDRKVGKVYVYPANDGWEVSGYYRRSQTDIWHPWLMKLDARTRLVSLSVKDADAGIAAAAESDARITAVP